MSVSEENADYLRERFVERVLRERPGSVLDVGCGAGGVLRRLLAAGVHAVGAEASPPPAGDLPIVRAVATALPFAAGAFDWVVMRHVPHHLADPRAAVHEASRVARAGLVLAEPWLTSGLPSQAPSARLDEWCKRQDRRRGLVHGPDHTAHELALLLPRDRDFVLEVEQLLRERRRPRAEVEALVLPRLPEDPSDPDYAKGLALIEDCGDGSAVNGTTILVARAEVR